MDNTPKGNRLHIALLGRTNVGKSSLLNLMLGQDIAITSPIAGTTTDIVEKAMELLPLGPVLFLDTAGLDDISELSGARLKKTAKVFDRTDVGAAFDDGVGRDSAGPADNSASAATTAGRRASPWPISPAPPGAAGSTVNPAPAAEADSATARASAGSARRGQSERGDRQHPPPDRPRAKGLTCAAGNERSPPP